MVSEHMLIYFALLALYIIDKVLLPHSIQSLPRYNMLRCFSCYLFTPHVEEKTNLSFHFLV